MTTVSRTISYRHTAGLHVGLTGAVTLGYDTGRPFEVALDFGTGCEVVRVISRDVLARRAPGLMDACCSASGPWCWLTLAGDRPSVTIRLAAGAVSKFLADTERLVPYGEERIDMDAGLALLLGGAA